MKLQELLEKYIRNTEVVLAEIEFDQFIQVDNEKVNLVVETANVILTMRSIIGIENNLRQD